MARIQLFPWESFLFFILCAFQLHHTLTFPNVSDEIIPKVIPKHMNKLAMILLLLFLCYVPGTNMK